METENQTNNETSRGKSKAYFTVGGVFLVAMALFWSVDGSLVYIFLGLACFFIFLGFYSEPRTKPVSPRQEPRRTFVRDIPQQEARTSSAESLGSILAKLREQLFRRGTGPVDARRIVRFVAIGIFLAFLFPIIVSIFGGQDGTDDSSWYFTSAEQYYATQQYDSAYINYKRAMQLDPGNTGAIVGYGNVLVVRNERDSAIMMFNKALEIDPDNKQATYYKALAFYDQKKYNDGIAILEPLIESNPDYYDAMLLLGDCYYIQKKYDEAITWYEDAYQNGGLRSRMLCHIMAYIYDTKGDYDKAIGLYQEALGYDSSVVEIYQRLGELIPGDDGNFYRTKAAQMRQ